MSGKKIGIIGGGAFGGTTAIKLAQAGYDVTVFEKNDNILKGTSFNNGTRRIHLGFHYPRDVATAKQSELGAYKFQQEYKECVIDNFPNYYFLAEKNSMVNYQQFLDFSYGIGVDFEKVDQPHSPLEVRNCQGGLRCYETVYNCTALREVILKRFEACSIKLICNANVVQLTEKEKQIEIVTDADKWPFDLVFNCSYSNLYAYNSDLGLPAKEMQYEYTTTYIYKWDIEQFGLTILDGSFITILPFENPGEYAIYHVDHSVIERKISEKYPAEWLDPGTCPTFGLDPEEGFQKIIKESVAFVPQLKSAKFIRRLEGPRMVLPHREDTDARPSLLNVEKENYVTVFSGKVDHCVEIAEKCVEYANSVM